MIHDRQDLELEEVENIWERILQDCPFLREAYHDPAGKGCPNPPAPDGEKKS